MRFQHAAAAAVRLTRVVAFVAVPTLVHDVLTVVRGVRVVLSLEVVLLVLVVGSLVVVLVRIILVVLVVMMVKLIVPVA